MIAFGACPRFTGSTRIDGSGEDDLQVLTRIGATRLRLLLFTGDGNFLPRNRVQKAFLGSSVQHGAEKPEPLLLCGIGQIRTVLVLSGEF